MGQIIVHKRNGEVRYVLDSTAKLCTVKSAEQKRDLLGEDTVTVKTESATAMEYMVGDYIEVFGDVYTLNKINEPTKIGERKFENTMVFEGLQYKLLDAQYRNTDAAGHNPSGEFQLVANMGLLMNLLINNIKRVAAPLGEVWELGDCIETEYKDFSFSKENCLGVLQRVCKDFNTEFEIEVVAPKHYKLHIRKAGKLFPATFSFGMGGGIYKLKRKNVNSNDIVTRLYVEGGTKNITTNYRNGAQRLRIADNEESYIDNKQAIAAFGVKEGSRVYEDIYPHRTGVVSSIVEGDIFKFVDNTMFDLKEKDTNGNTRWLIDGTAAKLKFVGNSNLAGYEFEIADYDTKTQTFTINQYEDKRGLKIPSAATAYQIKKGDKYVLLDIIMPNDPYVVDAETELKKAGTKDLEADSQPKVEYELEFASLLLKRRFGVDGSLPNLFKVGDYLPVKDKDINVDKAIRIKGFTRDCYKDEYSYKLTISDTAEVNIIEKLIIDNEEQNKLITLNQLTDVAKARANWRTTQELLNMVFDGDGFFDATNIRPNSIETLMLSVGNRAGQFILQNIVIEANAAVNGKPNPNLVRIGSNNGVLIHYAIEENNRTWNIGENTITLTSNGAYYLYARCTKAAGESGASLIFSQTRYAVDTGAYYYFPVGVLSSVYNGYRELTTTYGATRITGRTINCGRIESIDKRTYFDLDNSEIGGNIKFVSTDGTMKSIEELEHLVNTTSTALDGVNEIIEGLQSQVDGTVEYWFGAGVPTLGTAPANQWATELDKKTHLGDLYTDTATGLEYRFTKEGETYKWVNIPSTGIGQAIQTANNALETASSKNHTFLTANANTYPKPPYKIGDLWITLNDYKIRICTKEREALSGYSSSDWKDAGYTDDTNANAALQQLTDLATDGIITPSEKIKLKDELANIKVDYSTVKAKAQMAGCPTIGFDAAYSTLLAYVSALLSNMQANSTGVNKTTYNGNFSAYYKERTNLLDAVSKQYVDSVEVGNGNYIGNSAYFTDLKGWFHNPNDGIDINLGGTVFTQNVSPIYADSIMGNVMRFRKTNQKDIWFLHTPFAKAGGNILLPNEKFGSGITYTLAFWVKANAPIQLNMGFMNPQGDKSVAPYKYFTADTKWKRVVYTFVATGDSQPDTELYFRTDTADMQFTDLYMTKFVLVEGNKAPEWNSSNQEVQSMIKANKDLLKAITQNYTQIEGGLILSTFLKLGALQKSGAWIESAGLKAMLNSTDEIAAYFGGTYQEALAGDKEGMTIIYHNGKLKALNAEITGTINATNGTFSGKLDGVTGTFRVLQAVDSNGNVKAEIGFNSSEGKLYFNGDMQHQGIKDGRSLRFYSSDIWCRGSFGARERNVLVIKGAYGYYYPNGVYADGNYVSLASKTSSNGERYYEVNCYGQTGDYSGFPVDTIIFNIQGGTVFQYSLNAIATQRIMVINGNDSSNNVKIFSNGRAVVWNGGGLAEVVQMPTSSSFTTPSINTNHLGAGLLVGAFRDNNWQ